MSEKIDEEAQRRYKDHKSLVESEIRAEYGVAQADEVVANGKWIQLKRVSQLGRPVDDKYITERMQNAALHKEATDDSLDLARQATKAHVDKTREWKNAHIDELIDAANQDNQTRQTVTDGNETGSQEKVA
jgi:hypothetical protein